MGLLPTHTQIQLSHIMQQPWAVLIIKWSPWAQRFGIPMEGSFPTATIKVWSLNTTWQFKNIEYQTLFQLRFLISNQVYGRIKPIIPFVKLCSMIIRQSVLTILCWLLVGTVKKLKKLSPKCIRSLRSFEIMYGLKLET